MVVVTNLIGQSLGRYHILEQLGEGGMAVVYKGYDTRLEREVAVKVIRTDLFGSSVMERMLKRFEREARALAKLSHPHIIKVIDYGEHAGSPYFVMEYMPGGTLKQRLGKPIPWLETIRILIPIANALEYAHEHDIIHRDVKPANILMTEKGQPMLTDFGIAKLLETEETATLTGTGVGVGTPEYMAPEQWTGQSTAQSDIYSLGVVMYEMLTGRKPYTADTPAAVLFKQATEELPRPAKFVADLPQRVENILLKALAASTKDRYRTMAEFISALERLLDGKEASTHEKHSGINPPAISRKTLVTVGLAVLCFGLIAIIPRQLSALTTQVVVSITPSSTPAPTFTSTAAYTNTPPFTNTPQATVTSERVIGSIWIRPADGMEMVYVPEGQFIMGSNDGESNERPLHQVYLDAYWIDSTEVTNSMYTKCVQVGACKKTTSSDASAKDDKHPVTYIMWDDAQSYCSWAEVRLPTEAEWEKAARGTDGRQYPWGSENDPAMYYAGLWKNFETKPVGSHPSGISPYGAYDMAGNVFEWVNDWYSETYYQISPSTNPLGPDAGDGRVLRGGLWIGNDFIVRSAYRTRFKEKYSNNYIGFRCARSAPP